MCNRLFEPPNLLKEFQCGSFTVSTPVGFGQTEVSDTRVDLLYDRDFLLLYDVGRFYIFTYRACRTCGKPVIR